jgi:hypothetical protein
MRNRGRKQAKIVARTMRVAAALVCAYALALTTILSSWSALGIAAPADGDNTVLCVAHPDGADGGSAPVHRHSHHMLCGQICSMAGCGADLGLTVNTIFKPIAMGLRLGRLAGQAPRTATALFLSDHWVRGPPAA